MMERVMGLAELSKETFLGRFLSVGCDENIKKIAEDAKVEIAKGNQESALTLIMAFAPQQTPLPSGASQEMKETSVALQKLQYQIYYNDLKRLGGFNQSFMNAVADGLGVKRAYVPNITEVGPLPLAEYHVGG